MAQRKHTPSWLRFISHLLSSWDEYECSCLPGVQLTFSTGPSSPSLASHRRRNSPKQTLLRLLLYVRVAPFPGLDAPIPGVTSPGSARLGDKLFWALLVFLCYMMVSGSAALPVREAPNESSSQTLTPDLS